MMSPSQPGPRITFWGAAQSVTGSMHLVEHRGQKMLLDCGSVRSPRHPAHPHQDGFPFVPRELDAVVVSHAHFDHCGNVPALVRHGFTGPIYCTPATCDLLTLILANSARIQEEDSRVGRVIGRTPDETEPSFSRRDVEHMTAQCVAVPYEETREIGSDVHLRFVNAGHILGSAMVALALGHNGHSSRLTFTGDLGRRGSDLLCPPAPVPEAELVVSESTYGGRTLEPLPCARDALENVVSLTCERGGKVLIPAFNLGRTQVVIHALRQAMQAGRLVKVPIYVDSSLAADIVEVYRRHPECLASEALAGLEGGTIQYVPTPEDSREISHRREASIIIAPSGMCEGGRILHHLKNHMDDPRCSIVLVNYQAPHTLGHRLLQRGPTVRIHGRNYNKWAEVIYLAGFSGHADHDDLLSLLGPLAGRAPRLRLVHGEPEQAAALASSLRERGFRDIGIPQRGEMALIA